MIKTIEIVRPYGSIDHNLNKELEIIPDEQLIDIKYQFTYDSTKRTVISSALIIYKDGYK
jgi:hypothetical protein